MGINIDDLPEQYQRQAKRQLAPKTRTAVRSEDEKRRRKSPLDETTKLPAIHTPVCVVVSVWKVRGNWDADNIETYSVVDGLVAY